MAIYYEWDIETYDDTGEIESHYHANKLSDYPHDALYSIDGIAVQLVLVYNKGNEIDGLQHRQWAYVERVGNWWQLPESFDEGATIPERFRKELEQHRPAS